MAKLYPPNIEGTIPAFYGTTIVVPFSMNMAVGASEIKAISLKVKKVNSTEIILTKTSTQFDAYSTFKAYFILSQKEQELFNIGQYYRVQLAYVDNTDTIGYYSTVGVIKYTSCPVVSLAGLNRATSNAHMYDYTGVYQQIDDPTEKLYSSRLYLYDSKGNVVSDTGEVLHSVLNDVVPNEATEKFNIPIDLELNETYKLNYVATSVNGLKVSSPKYKIIQRENSDMKFDVISKLNVIATSNYDQGVIQIRLSHMEMNNTLSGMFLLSRTEAKKPYKWEKINKFVMTSEDITKRFIIDYTVEQGKHYIYSLQQYNNYGIYSRRLLSNEVVADFEDLFLLDNKRQLKIKFNPKVSSMKNNILENKVNTIGSKYPFITRNGNVNHKEFSLSGLISYQMDDNREFYSWKDLGIEQNITDLITENICAERDFKLEVLEWLTNFEPKILKSPVEGNYLVKLLGVTLSPNDTVGRMLHTFNCTASEIAPFSYDYLNKYDFLQVEEPDATVSKWKTISLISTNEETGEKEYLTGEILDQPVYSIRITDMNPGSQININGEPVYIGITQSYSAKVTSPIYSLVIPEGSQYSGFITYEYKDKMITDFDKVRGIILQDVPAHQFIGDSYWADGQVNIINNIKDIKTEIVDIPFTRFYKRGVHKIYTSRKTNKDISLKKNFYLEGDNFNHKVTLSNLEKTSLYKIYWSKEDYNMKDINGEIYYFDDEETFLPYSEYYYDPISDKIIEDSYNIYNIIINSGKHEPINIEDTEEYEAKGLIYDYISIGDGVIAELTYLKQTMEYSYEFDNPEVVKKRKAYDKILQKYLDNIENPKSTQDNAALLKSVKAAYKELLDALTLAIIEDQTHGGA